MIGIYCIRNVVNNHRYIGQSVNIKSRKNDHFTALKHGKHFNPRLQAAYTKYGATNFVFEVLEKCTKEQLSDREIFWIAHFGGYTSTSVYNISPGGTSNYGEHNPRYGKHWSEEWRTQQSCRMKDYFSDPTRHPMYGKHFSEESRQKMSMVRQGMCRSEAAKKKTSDTLKRRFASGELVSPMKGKHHSENTKKRLRNRILPKHTPEQLKKMSDALRGEKNPMYGKTHTIAARTKLSESHMGEKNHAYGKVRITDGVINKFWDKNTPLPEGFHLGMRPRNPSIKN